MLSQFLYFHSFPETFFSMTFLPQNIYQQVNLIYCINIVALFPTLFNSVNIYLKFFLV